MVDVTTFLSSCVRSVIIAPKGKKLVVVDYASVESRIVAWLSNCSRMQDLFRNGKDSYKDFASELFGVPYDEVTPEQRKYSKPPTLGCFTPETEVLTPSGFKDIVSIRDTDKLWDGIRWVKHDGIVYQGVKKVIGHHGVQATPEHRILTAAGWVHWSWLRNENINHAVLPGTVLSGNNSSETNQDTKAPTYDILNAGPLKRFAIKTSKGLVLAHNCAYQLGRYGLIEYAKGMGTEMTEDQAEHAVKTFRSMYWEIPQMWEWLVDAQKDVISNYTVHQGYAIKIWRDNNFMFITLPSGRSIAYYKPLVEMKVPPWGGRPRSTITYMGRAKVGRAWVRLTTHGGKTIENECQGIGRDKLGDDMLHIASRTNWDVVLHVHDEPVLEVPEDRAEEALAYTIRLMSKPPTWAPGLLMGAAGFITDRYTKD